MATTATTGKAPTSGATKADEGVRVKEIERDPGAILHRAADRPVRVTAKDGTRMFHIATIRRGDRKDPAWAGSLPVTVAALERRAGRILRLASGLQIALRVQATATSTVVFFIEPGRDCLDFANQRLGGSSRDAALLKNALHRSKIARDAAERAAKQADARRQAEIKSLQGRIATLEHGTEKQAGLAEALKKAESALRDARLSQKAAEKSAADKDAEVQSSHSRIAALERAAKRQTAIRSAPVAKPQPEAPAADTAAGEAPRPLSIFTA